MVTVLGGPSSTAVADGTAPPSTTTIEAMTDEAGVGSSAELGAFGERDDDDGVPVVTLVALTIPLIAVGIPFLAVAGSMGLGGVVLGIAGGLVALMVSATLAKGVMRQRHMQRMAELRLQLEVTRQETAKLAEVNRVIDRPVLGS